MTTMLNVRSRNFVRITEEQYKSDIAAAEERGRANVTPAISQSVAASAVESTAASAQWATIDAIPFASEFPELVTQMKAEGLSVPAATVKIVHAMQQRKPAETKAAAEAQDVGAQIEARVAKATTEGRRIGLAQAAAELAAEGRDEAEILGAKIADRVAKARAQGRKLGFAEAAAELGLGDAA